MLSVAGSAGRRGWFGISPSSSRTTSPVGLGSLAIITLVALSAVAINSSASAAPLFDAGFRSFNAGAGARSLAIGDFTHDGRPDIVVANSGAPTVSLLESRSDGSLGLPVAFGAGPDRSAAVTVGDVNGDDLLDVVYADGVHTDAFSSVGVLLGRSGGLLPATTYPVGRGARWVTLSDVNGDGALDLLAVNSDPFYDHSVSVLLGDGLGAFGSRHDIDFGVGVGLTCVVAGDLNGDGHNDIVAVDPGGTFVYVRLGSGDGSFGPSAAFAVGISPPAIALADLNGDGHLDIVSGGDQATLLLGNGNGTFAPRRFLDVGGGMPVVADLNRDGIPDIAFTGGSEVTVLLGTGSGNFAPASFFSTGFTAVALAVGDINGDGILDIATSNEYTSTVSVLLGGGDGSFGRALAYPVGSYPTSAAAGDLDGDGIPDLAVANSNSGTVSLLAGRGDGTFAAATSVAAAYPLTVAIQDLNHDGVQDLIVGGAGVSVFLGSGGMTYGPVRTYAETVYFTSVAVGDLNGDGIPDLAATHPGRYVGDRPPQWIPGTVVYVFFGVGDGTFLAETTHAVGQTPYDLAIADVDGEGRNDLVVTNAWSSTISVLLADESGGFRSQAEYPTAGGATALALADFGGDGHVDVVVASQSTNQLSILQGRGDGTFGAPTVIGSFNSPQALSAADLDRDGHIDVVLSTEYGNGVTILRGTGSGAFAAGEVYGTGVGPRHVAVKDLNGDGHVDLAVPNAYAGTVSILRNRADAPTPTLISLVEVDVSAEWVRLTWWSESIHASQARVERSGAGDVWVDLGRPESDGSERMKFEDRTVHEGDSYTYRLAVNDVTGTLYVGQTTVRVPSTDRLDLAVTPNPVSTSGLITFHLATRDEARLDIWDIAGRRVWGEQIGRLGPGRHSIELPARSLRPGAYVIRLTQARRAIARRMIVVR